MGVFLGAGTWARQRKPGGKDPSRPASEEKAEEPCIAGPVVSEALLVLWVYEWSLEHRRILASLRTLAKISLRTLPALESQERGIQFYDICFGLWRWKGTEQLSNFFFLTWLTHFPFCMPAISHIICPSLCSAKAQGPFPPFTAWGELWGTLSPPNPCLFHFLCFTGQVFCLSFPAWQDSFPRKGASPNRLAAHTSLANADSWGQDSLPVLRISGWALL